jgi:hypothetical protein
MLLPAVAIGFHGCDREVGEKVLSGAQEIRPSENPYDWLGRGAYFWEGDPHRAKTWAEYLRDNPAASRSKIKTPFVVGAILKLGSCLDLTHSAHLEIVRAAFVELDETFKMTGRTLPQNKPAGKGDADLVKRYRDRLVLDYVHEVRQRDKKPAFDTVRASFPEGEALYDGAKITERSHVQICVRNPQCVLGYFRPIWNRYA